MAKKKSENKTQPTEASVNDYFSAIQDEGRRADCEALNALIIKATKETPTMWGSSIVGYGSYHYVYDSGREGDMCLVGFSSRAGEIALYGLGEVSNREELLAKLGKHKTAKACVYIKKLADVDLKVLEKLIASAYKESKKKHGSSK